MLECGRVTTRDQVAAHRLLKTSVKTAKMCLEHDILPLAHKILERASDYQEELSRIGTNAIEPDFSIASLKVEYLMVRISLVTIFLSRIKSSF